MKRLIIMMLFVATSTNAQYNVTVAGHEIIINDSIAKQTVKEFFFYADKHRVDYLTMLKGMKEVRKVNRYKTYIGEVRDGILFFNSYVDKYPYTKRILILHLIGKHYGLVPTPGGSYKVMNEHFVFNDKTEKIYINRFTLYLDMKDLIKQLEVKHPLNTRVE